MCKKNAVLALLIKMVAIEKKQFGGITECQYTEQGWEGARFVYKKLFRDLLLKAEGVALIGYDPLWLDRLPPKEQPSWSSTLNANVQLKNDIYYLTNVSSVIDELYSFWVSPRVYYKDDSNRNCDVLVATPVIKIEPALVNPQSLIEVIDFFGDFSNPWQGGQEKAGKWTLAELKGSDCLYLPLQNFSAMSFFANIKALSLLVDNVLSTGLEECIEEHVPEFWLEEFIIKYNESVEDAATRLFPDT